MSQLSNPKNTQYLFIDMNSFFASCEQQANPLYRNKPIAVTPVNCDNGCIVSASYDAKAKEIKTGTLVKEAKRLCPNIIIRESNTYLYIDYHRKIVKILESFSPFLSIRSVDEAVIKLSPSEQNTSIAMEIGRKIKQKIQQNVGEYLKSSIGIGLNVFLAKQATEFRKPDGLYEIKLENLEWYYQQIKLTDIKGIAQGMERQLYERKIYTPLDFYHSTQEDLMDKLGAVGNYWYLKLHGYDLDEKVLETPKTVGHSHVLEPKYRNWNSTWAVCQKLMEKVAYRLRAYGLKTNGVYLGVRFYNGGFSKRIKTSPFSDSRTLTRIIYRLWKEIDKNNTPFKISVTLYDLTRSPAQQLKLFTSMNKDEAISVTMDLINDKYGAFSLKPASILSAEKSAPDRIAFGRPIY
ncbi:hypothetical protein A3F08_00265 [Candidatus Berkelbacteria bacterium RIFCSPHIGHO2_12_FULL_36_9]|uniref:UmuC domain-containing protein n=1 Tax=Candidatus Berkelbacteria bacterium RIFCSPHIGHO2_12_FULL_36_9 TaxID=1797469 RepID=A0A1F5EDB1_9BACT|nr:MAG: hypothetical protein A3F08_00265 [Candidatus Berkelbacteria bacterium RIFCSPHIGHO2_12_FULL_36_9]